MDDDDFFPPSSANSPVPAGVLLVASNLVLAFAIYYTLECRDYATSLFFYALMLMSGMYHECRAFNKCVVPFEAHIMLDYIFVYISLIWTITAVGIEHAIHYRKRLIVFIVFFSITIVFIFNQSSAWLVALVGPVGAGIVMITLSIIHQTPLFKVWQMAVLGLVLGGIGGFFMYLTPYEDYDWAHTLWHIFSMLALFSVYVAVYGFISFTPLVTYVVVRKVYQPPLAPPPRIQAQLTPLRL